jgi:MraZ protein
MGYAITGIDLKGRVSIPAFLRSALAANQGKEIGTLTIARHANSNCLIGYDRAWTRLIGQQIEKDMAAGRGPTTAAELDTARRRAFGMVEEIQLDASGRIILQGFLRQKAGLTDAAFFYGHENVFEIWSPQVALNSPEIDGDTKEYIAWEMARRAK